MENSFFVLLNYRSNNCYRHNQQFIFILYPQLLMVKDEGVHSREAMVEVPV